MRRRTAPHGSLARLALVMALLGAACSSDYDRLATNATTTTTNPRATTTTVAASASTTSTTLARPTTTPPPGGATPTTTTTTANTPGSPAALPGRLAVIALDGSLLTMRPDGTDQQALAIGSPGTSVTSPAWSSDASRLVWTALATNSVRVRSAKVDGTDVHDAVLAPQGSLYLWNSASSALAALRATSNSSVELDTIDLTTLVATPLRTGAPVYAAWSPDGTRLVVHAGTNEVSIISASGALTTLPVAPASFGAPAWLDDHTVLIGVRDASTQYLSLVDVNTGTRRDLVSYAGGMRFALAPEGKAVAYELFPDAGGGTGANVSFPQATTPPTTSTTVPQATPNQLAVIDIATRAITTVSSSASTAFAWSPSGVRLAYLSPDPSGAYRWHYFGPDGTIDGASYLPTRVFLQQVTRSFDQLTQSVQWWSPDSSAFVYAGVAGSRTGVWVQQIKAGLAPTFITDGDTVAWSPK